MLHVVTQQLKILAPSRDNLLSSHQSWRGEGCTFKHRVLNALFQKGYKSIPSVVSWLKCHMTLARDRMWIIWRAINVSIQIHLFQRTGIDFEVI